MIYYLKTTSLISVQSQHWSIRVPAQSFIGRQQRSHLSLLTPLLGVSSLRLKTRCQDPRRYLSFSCWGLMFRMLAFEWWWYALCNQPSLPDALHSAHPEAHKENSSTDNSEQDIHIIHLDIWKTSIEAKTCDNICKFWVPEQSTRITACYIKLGRKVIADNMIETHVTLYWFCRVQWESKYGIVLFCVTNKLHLMVGIFIFVGIGLCRNGVPYIESLLFMQFGLSNGTDGVGNIAKNIVRSFEFICVGICVCERSCECTCSKKCS